MKFIKAIGFDLFDTLIIVKGPALRDALNRLITALKKQGFIFDEDAFVNVYRQTARRLIAETRKDGRETHNRFWISAALRQLGYDISPEDPRIAAAVNHYFATFNEYISLIPGVREMLQSLQGDYRLGLLSNFTHPPAVHTLLKELALTDFFDVILISGEIGYRKPHPFVFTELYKRLGVAPSELLYVGDNPEDDIEGALRLGIQPVWMKYTWKRNNNFANRFSPLPDKVPDDSIPAIEHWEELLILLKSNSRKNTEE